jgi:bifunctional non-homologous end joining protein LigD
MPSFRPRVRPLSGKVEPCLPRLAKEPPAGPDWIHEIKHDGFRITGRREGSRVRLISRNGHDLTYRFPLVAAAIAQLPVHSCLIDGEAIVCDENGLAVFQLMRNYRRGNAATLRAFDLIELNGEDLRPQPIEDRKLALKKLLGKTHPGIAYNRHFDVEGAIVFKNACALGCEGIVSKRLGTPYRAGRSAHWLKIKNPAAPAVKREAEEDWRADERR